MRARTNAELCCVGSESAAGACGRPQRGRYAAFGCIFFDRRGGGDRTSASFVRSVAVVGHVGRGKGRHPGRMATFWRRVCVGPVRATRGPTPARGEGFSLTLARDTFWTRQAAKRGSRGARANSARDARRGRSEALRARAHKIAPNRSRTVRGIARDPSGWGAAVRGPHGAFRTERAPLRGGFLLVARRRRKIARAKHIAPRARWSAGTPAKFRGKRCASGFNQFAHS